MSSYTRFLDSEKLSKQFWGFKPRNPTCGLISLELGTKIWLWTSIVSLCAKRKVAMTTFLIEKFNVFKLLVTDCMCHLCDSTTGTLVQVTADNFKWRRKEVDERNCE